MIQVLTKVLLAERGTLVSDLIGKLVQGEMVCASVEIVTDSTIL